MNQIMGEQKDKKINFNEYEEKIVIKKRKQENQNSEK